ncbi:hypothetical protein BLOT_016757 [Blomia tropicalis]|nr:hypothetical protein BLOT_016757 [Blomia tropicalis]
MASKDLNAVETNESDISPFSNKIKIDLELRYPKDLFELNVDKSKDELKQYLKNYIKITIQRKKKKYELNEEGFPSGWELLTIASNPSLSNGYFGAAFWHPEREQVIIAHRGTKPTNVGSLWTDFKSVLKNEISSQINSAVTFTHHVQQVFADIDSEGKTHFQMFITGHSLGAWLAQVCTFSMKYLTIVDKQKYFGKSMKEGYHAHTVVFDSPGCKPMLLKMKDWYDVRNDNVENLPINSLDITSYLSAPNLVNTCNTHVGKIYRVFIDFPNESYFTDLFYTLKTHSLDNILNTFDKKTGLYQKNDFDNYKLYEVIDWPGNTGIIKKEEYNEFLKWADKLNEYHLTCENIQFKNYYPIRYQTKPFDEKQCSFNVFTQSEQSFLKQFHSIQAFPDFFKLDTLFSDKDIVNKLNKISINENENIVSICDGSFEELYNTILHIKRLLIFHSEYVEKIENLKFDNIVKKLYKHVSDNYLEINKNWLKFRKYKPYGIDKLEGAYVDLFEEVNHETLKSNLSNNSIETVYFISGLFIDENKEIKILSNILNFDIEHKVTYLKFPYSLQSEMKNIYLVDELFNKNNFDNLCSEHSNKIMYWIYWDGAKFNLQKIFNPNFYIERNFNKILIKNEVEMFQNPDSFVFIGLNNFEDLKCLFDYYSPLLTKNIHIMENANSAIEIFNEINGNVHLMEIETFEDKKQIVWRNSKGSIKNIRQYIDSSDNSDSSFENEDSLIDLIKDKQTIIIADDPGKGKSTTLIKLYQSTLKSNNNKKLFESNWIIHVNLRNNIQTIKSFLNEDSFDVDSFVQFLSKFNNNLSYKFSQKLLKNALLKKDIHKPLLISFDSFDELHNSINRDKFIEFLKIFKNKTKVKIWITTRTHCSEVLENALSTFAITFSPMKKKSIASFIFNYLKIRSSLISNYEIYDTIFVKENTNNKLIIDFIENFLVKVKTNLIKLFDTDKNVLIELINNKNFIGSSVLNTAAEGDNIEIIEKLFAVFVGDFYGLNFAIDIVYSYDISKYVSCNLNSLSKIL